MSLFRQLWLTVILITLASFLGSFTVSILSMRSYLEQQLHRKNVDSASSLATSISQLSKDPVTIGVQIAALFDSGQYERISITAPDGKVIAERVRELIDTTVPEWFSDIFPISVEAGHAQISDNRMHFGVIKVVSNDRMAQQVLWDQTGKLIIWYLVASIVSGLVGVLILRGIKRPLATMVDQAEAITERHFLTISEPRIPELRSIARATNDMVRRLHNRAIEETLQLEALNKRMNHDPVTGLANRGHFMNRLHEAVDGGDTVHSDTGGAIGEKPAEETPMDKGFLVLMRIGNLEEINEKLGRSSTNGLLRQVGAIMDSISTGMPNRVIGRLNGSDFALIIPHINDAAQLLNSFSAELIALLSQTGVDSVGFYHIGAVRYRRGDRPAEILTGADTALATAQGKGAHTWHIIDASYASTQLAAGSIGDWRHIFSDAVSEDRFKLVLYPVVDAAGALLHQEAVVRMQAVRNGGWLAANDFIPIAARLNLTGPLDLTVVRHALEYLQSSAGELAINISAETISDWNFRNKLEELLRQQPDLCSRLWIEVPEYGVFRRFEAFRDFCHTFRALGCRIGVEHFGHHSTELQKLADMGLHYLKVDASFVHGINQNKNNQKLLKALCNLSHTLGIVVIALGMQTEAECKALIKLGFDGVTGPGVKDAS
ncbi:bifunctional diguanylate cyclase/phosphodiesterase [Nitrosovibrio tenuis]|uniref:Diguanylate cyclase/phosphodiesterase n=1 Tax=Nitrosovibrio tenuis TaxID=1233 RepID=A0A1H7NJK0_9PROT|nr:EAL domain-containing protein [Nitrosovibrio tenuis]SEL23722.1 diguanylate cyclase/phosphodiesterase [Nitrosovibrio tenuis]